MNIGDVLARKKPQRRSVPVLLEPDLAEKHALLLLDLRKAERVAVRSNDRDIQDAPVLIADAIEALEGEVEDATVTFVVEAVGAERWSELVGEHPPTPEQEAEGWPYDAESMGPMLLSESIVEIDGEPETVSEKQAAKIWNDWSDAERSVLFLAAVAVNREVRNVPFTRPVSRRTESSEKN